MGENLGFARRSDFGGISHFLLLRDQAIWKRSFEEIQGKKTKP